MCGNNNNNNNNNDIGMSYDQNLAVDIRHITDISFTFLLKQIIPTASKLHFRAIRHKLSENTPYNNLMI